MCSGKEMHSSLADLLEEGDLVFDVGANIGDKAEKFLQKGLRVVCIEPQPACVRELHRKFKDNPNVIIVEKGLAAQPGLLQLQICSTSTTISTFSEEWKKGRFSDYQWDQTIEVEVTTLDEIIKSFGHPEFCKIDVEGFEYQVLQGLHNPVPYLSFEFTSEFLINAKECVQYLKSIGYDGFNVTFGEDNNFMLSGWVDADDLYSFISREMLGNNSLWGDIYTRYKRTGTILDQIRQSSLWSEGHPLRLHLGCGENHFDGYINIDYPSAEHTVQTRTAADMFADIVSLDFPEQTIDEIRLHHVFEHFSRITALALLVRWHLWLKVGGKLHIETPDLIGSARTLLSKVPWNVKMGVVRHLAGTHEASWAYHIDHWFSERFEHTLGKFGFAPVEIYHDSWPHEPYLSNVSAVAWKSLEIPLHELLQIAEGLLWESTVSSTEKSLFEVWKRELHEKVRHSEGVIFGKPAKCRLEGIDIHFDDQSLDDIGFDDGNSETNGEFSTAAALIHSSDIVFDVGASKGMWSSFVLNNISPSVRLWVFEPIQEVFAILADNLNNHKVSLYNIAVSDSDGSATFWRYFGTTADLTELSSFYRRGSEIEHNLKLSVTPIKVNARRLDTFCDQHGVRTIDYLKIDTEGAELDVLRGADKLLKSHSIRIIQFEYGGTYADAGIALRQIYELLTDYGYFIFRITADGLIHIGKWRDSLENYRYANYIALIPSEEEIHFLNNKAGRSKTHSCTSGSTAAVPEKIKSPIGLIFSKDRPMQLDATLRSFYMHCRDAENVSLKVFFTTSGHPHREMYEVLMLDYPSVGFVEEKDFKSDVLTLLQNSDYVLFLVDDNIFVKDFSMADVISGLRECPDAAGFSLRLGKNTTYCYPFDREQSLPKFDTLKGNEYLKFDWTTAEYDFGYPFEVSSSVYRTHEILPFISQFPFFNPNSLEAFMAENAFPFKDIRPSLLCFNSSVTFCTPLNKVQNTSEANRVSANIFYAPGNLSGLFSEGYRIDVNAYNGFLPKACHQEVELKMLHAGPRVKEGQPLVSVIIPCYNQAQYLPEAVESVVNQTYINWECIIVNDGSPDNTSEVAREFIAKYPDKKIVLLEKKNSGPSDTRNYGIRNSKGKYILPLDADDFMKPERIQKMVALLESDKEIAIAYTDTIHFGSVNKTVNECEYDFKMLRFQNHINYSSLYRREAWEGVGGYNTNMILGYEDWDFWIACGEKGFYGKRIPEPLLMYRVKKSSRNTVALDVHDKLLAQIILNHPDLYEQKDVIAAKRLLSITDACPDDKSAARTAVDAGAGIRRSISNALASASSSSGTADNMPHQVHFLMNDKCNAKCIMCGGDYFRSKSGRTITLEKFKIMATNLRLQYFQSIVLAGAGDPLLNRDLIPIIQFTRKDYPHISIAFTTNGIALSEKISKQLLENDVASINISINSATRQTYKRIMQVDCFEQVCSNVARLVQMKNNVRKTMRVQLSSAINRLNIEELPDLVELGRRLGIDSINLMYCRFYPERIRHLNIENPEARLSNDESLYYHQELSDAMVGKAKFLAGQYRIGFTHEPLFKEKASPRPCTWHFNEIMVGFDGEVYPCGGSEVHFKEKVEAGVYNFGNVLKEPLEAIWNNEQYRALRISSMQDGLCLIPECRYCANMMSPNDIKSHIMDWDERPCDLTDTGSTNPLVSVIVPTYNRPGMLAATLESILSQTYLNIEIVVVNDAGPDVEEVIRKFNRKKNIKYIRHTENKGLAATRNTGIKAAKGKYIAYLDDDDIFYPEHVETLINFLSAGAYKVAYSDTNRAYQEMKDGRYVTTKREVANTSDFDYDRILFENFIPVLCFMHEKSCIDETGFFDETLGAHEDWDLWMRMSRKFKFGHISKITSEFSWRTDNSTMTFEKKEVMDSTRRIVFERGQALQQQMSDKVRITSTTLCCIDCCNHELSIRALEHSMSQCSFDRVAFFTDKDFNLSGIDVIRIPTISTKEQYSRFVIKELNKYINTDFTLMIQYDGFIINPDAWTKEFLKYDYIGAKWQWYNDDFRVGNGGFSLRSKRLMQALSDESIQTNSVEYGEDTLICRTYRSFLEDKYGIKFAPEILADRFSYERSGFTGNHPFGFHGLFNMWRYITPEYLPDLINNLSPKTLGSIEALELGMNYHNAGQLKEAETVYRKILEFHPGNVEALNALNKIGSAGKTIKTGRNEPCPCGSGKKYKKCCGGKER